MPTYQYACTECGHDFEAVQSFTDDALTECPACRGRLRKVFGSVGVVFKGSGFYRNDSREAAKNASTAPRTRTRRQGQAGSETKAGRPRAVGQEGRRRGRHVHVRPGSGSSGSRVRRRAPARPQRAAPPDPSALWTAPAAAAGLARVLRHGD